MKTIMRWTTLCASFLAFALLSTLAAAQTAPTIQGTSVADPAVPVLVTPAPAGSGFFVLNQDFSLLQHSTVDTSQNQSCNGPGIFSRTIAAPRTLVTDLYSAYFTGPDGDGANTAIDALTPEVSCTPVQAFDYTGGLSQQSVSSNDPQHGLFYTVSAYDDGVNNDQLIVLQNLNNATVSSSNKFNELNEASLDLGGLYTSINSDTRGDFGLTAITELKTDTSPGNLWVYYPQTNSVYKILGPGGAPLLAVTSFIIPSQTDGGGSLLVLVNQDGLTDSNQNAPPQDTTPITIIDLGQLRPLLDVAKPRGTITLPFVTQITATTPFYAMLGGAYNPLDHRVYVIVAGGTSTTNVVENIISYDTLNPAAPGELVVADVSSVMLSEGYPQLAMNAASGTMQILPLGSGTLYSVGITGTGNTAVSVPGSTFPDANFTPTYIAANPLQGETYIASSSGQVDVLTRPATLQGGLTLSLTGSDLGFTSQQYQVTPLALWPVYDDSLATTKLTITVTPVGGTPVVLATGHVSDVGYPGGSFYTYTFPAAGQYTIVATADASALYPAVTSPPLNVFVGNTGVYPTAVALSIPATVAATNGGATLNAMVTLTGTTYGPSGAVYIQDPTGAEVGNVQLPNGVIANPITVPITINEGVQTLTAVYEGDEQNQGSKSAPQTITVGTVAKVTPTFTVTVPGTAKTGASVAGTVKFLSSSTTAPTGTVTIYATLAGSTTANQIATATAAQAFASAGASFTFTAPVAGSYTVFAGYGGDASYNNAVSPNVAIAISGPTLQTTVVGIVAPATVTAGTAFNVVIGFNVEGAFTTQPTGNIVLTATQAGGASITLGMVTPAQGMAPGGGNISATLPNAGVYTLTANYAGDSLYAASSNMASITVKSNAAPTTLSVSGPANVFTSASFITTVTLKATGSSTAAITGSVTLMATGTSGTANSYSLGTMPAASALASGGVQFTGSIPVAGTYSLAAVYAGDTNYSMSTGSVVVSVGQATTTLALSGSTTQGVGVAFPLTVRLATQSGATGTPTGNVVVAATPMTGGTTTTVATITAAQAAASGGYQAQVTLPAAGSFTVTATYAGDANFGGSTASLVVAASQTNTLAVTVSPLPVVVLQNFTLKIVMTSTTTTAVPTGNFMVTSTSGNNPPFLEAYVPAALSTSGGATSAPLSEGILGAYLYTVTYPGDANYPPLTATVTINVGIAPTSLNLTAAATATALVPFQVVTKLTAVSNHNMGVLTLTATLNGSSTPVSTFNLTPNDALSGVTSLVTFPAAGSYTLKATYSGDGNDTASSATQVVSVGAAPATSFTLKLDDPAAATGSGGLSLKGTTSTGLTLKSSGAGPGPVNLTATGNTFDTLVFRDAVTHQLITSATPTAAGTKITVELDSSAPTAGLRMHDLRNHPSAVSFAGGLLGIALLGLKRRRLWLRSLSLLSVLLFALTTMASSGCGGTTEQVLITATPVTASTAAPPQSVTIDIHTSN